MVNCHAEFSGYKTSGSNVFFSKHSFFVITFSPSYNGQRQGARCELPRLFSLDARNSVVKVYPHLGGHSPLRAAPSLRGVTLVSVCSLVLFFVFSSLTTSLTN